MGVLPARATAEFAEKIQQRGIHLCRALALDPVAAALDDHLALQAGYGLRHLRQRRRSGGRSNHAILGPGNEQHRLADGRILPWRQQFPIAIDIAIPVEAAAEPGARIFRRVEIDMPKLPVGRNTSCEDWPYAPPA